MNLVFFILLAMEAGCGQLQHCNLCHLPKAAYTSSTLWIIEPKQRCTCFPRFLRVSSQFFQHWLSQRSRKDVGDKQKHTLSILNLFPSLANNTLKCLLFHISNWLTCPWKCGRPLPFPTTEPTTSKIIHCQIFN